MHADGEPFWFLTAQWHDMMGLCPLCPPPHHLRCLKWCPAESSPSNTGRSAEQNRKQPPHGIFLLKSSTVTWMLPSHYSLMEMQGSKRKRVYPFEPNTVLLANFSHEYLAHLLPALMKIGKLRSCREGKEKEVEKIVMFQVNMALVASASGFSWSRALRQKLEGGMKVKKFPIIMARQLATSNLSSSCKQKNAFDMKDLWALPPPISRPLAPTRSHMDAKPNVSVHKTVKPRRTRWTASSKRKLPREDEKLHGRIRTLRRILPGGNSLGVSELLSEVGSYVICLELQVNILRSLLGTQEQTL